MANRSTDKKLELIRRIREESNHNQTIITGREDILKDPVEHGQNHKKGFLLKLRSIVAMMLFLLCFWCQKVDTNLDFFDYEQITTYLSEEINLNSIDFMEDIPYTLDNAKSMELDFGKIINEEGL